ncbi:t-SNARE VTI1 [Blastocladiella emersonii ATCC 22665]|nr:t-SNARE VTI1 [Blastocladiella emersonii ATCC 22665]
MADASELFKDYEQDLVTLTTSLSAKLRDLGSGALVGEQWKTLLRAAERELDEADEIVASMDNELFALPPPTRAKLQPKFRQYKSDQEKYRKEFLKLTSSPSAREALLGPAGAPANFDDAGADQRSRLLQGTERLQQTGDRLTNTHRIALETEQTGIETLEELRRQRQQLERARNTLRDVDGNVDRAGRTLRTMARRLSTNKLITAAIVCMLVVLILMVLILKFR